jgi:ABC-type bacteriocin/lantibiotic exporter with double-glycine peptidase domain
VASVLNVSHCQQKADAQMALTYLGIPCSQDDMAHQLGIRPHVGAPSSRLLRLRSVALDVIYAAGDLPDLADWLDQETPVLAFVQADQLHHWRGLHFQHTVVVVGLDDQYVHLLDPAADAAPLRVSRGDFMLAWDEMDCIYAVIASKK